MEETLVDAIEINIICSDLSTYMMNLILHDDKYGSGRAEH